MNSAESATFAANQNLQEAIAWADRALKLAVQARRDQHWLALKEHRVIGLIDAVQHETRISEAILLLKGAFNAPGLGAPAFGFVPAGHGGEIDPVDKRPHKSAAVDGLGAGGVEAEDGDRVVCSVTCANPRWAEAQNFGSAPDPDLQVPSERLSETMDP